MYKLQSNANDRRYMAEILPTRHENTIQSTNADYIGLKKNETMSLSSKHPQRIQLYGKDLTNSRSFTYLGSIVTTDGGANENIKARLGETRGP